MTCRNQFLLSPQTLLRLHTFCLGSSFCHHKHCCDSTPSVWAGQVRLTLVFLSQLRCKGLACTRPAVTSSFCHRKHCCDSTPSVWAGQVRLTLVFLSQLRCKGLVPHDLP
ncbi:hypothetical protein J6590_079496 [Homalodisca vitripennis]|nr:hypothetical protein J6590_079496 [Homalodisca vitripennis]